MTTKIFVNLPVKDLQRSIAFFKALGFHANPQFTDDTAACIVISEHIYSMLLTHEKFREFTKKDIVDSTRATEVLIALSMESRDQVNAFVGTALKAGATAPDEPRDYGFMFQRTFDDLDGHTWEIFWMDPAQLQDQQPQ